MIKWTGLRIQYPHFWRAGGGRREGGRVEKIWGKIGERENDEIMRRSEEGGGRQGVGDTSYDFTRNEKESDPLRLPK